jgi:hypothetical protein
MARCIECRREGTGFIRTEFNDYVCVECFSQRYVFCDCCHRAVVRSAATEDGGGYLCDDCAVDNWAWLERIDDEL